MVVSQQHRFVGIQIPHTGSTSFGVWCRRYFEARKIQSKHAWRVPEKFEHYPRYCLVRNPYERMLTWWWFGKERGSENVSFEQFMEFIIERREWAPEAMDGRLKIPEFYQPQFMWIERTRIDDWVKLEEVPQGLSRFPFVGKKVPPFPHRNRTVTKPRVSAYDYLSDSQKRLVLEYCEKDFEVFGYAQ